MNLEALNGLHINVTETQWFYVLLQSVEQTVMSPVLTVKLKSKAKKLEYAFFLAAKEFFFKLTNWIVYICFVQSFQLKLYSYYSLKICSN